MKNIKNLFTALLLMCSTVASAYDFKVGGIYYNITDVVNRTVEVTFENNSGKGVKSDYEGDVTIPETVNYRGIIYRVTSISSFAFFGCTSLSSIVIPNSVTSIGKDAFKGCKSLKVLHIADGKSTLSLGYSTSGNGLLYDCPLEKLFLGRNLSDNTILTYSPFYNKKTLTSVKLGNSVTSIGDNAFKGCTGLTSIVIPNSIRSIGYGAFRDCSGLASIEIPNSVTSFGESAFKGCTGLKTVINFSNLTFSKGSSGNGYVAYYADKVYNAPYGSIEGDFIFGKPNNVNTLLYYLGNATELTLPADYNDENYTIGADVFNGNTTITSIIIPNSVTSFGWNVFKGCSGLKKVEINCASVENWFSGLPSIQEVVLSDGVTSIGDYAFDCCKYLTSVEIPNSVKSIGEHAFKGCSGLTSIVIPNSVTSIGDNAFKGCTGLTSIVIPNSVTNIGEHAFEGCSGLKKVEINCASVENWFSGLPSIQEVVLSDGVTSIGDYAFDCCKYLTSVEIPNSVTSIGDNAFKGCTGLTSIEIPNSVTSIGNSAFEDCTSLTSIEIPNSVTYIGERVFSGCSGLINIVVSEGNIVYDSRKNCNAIIDTSTNHLILGCKNTLIPNSVTSIGDNAFKGCTGLTSIVIPNSIRSIGYGAFEGCKGLKTVINFSNLTFSKGSSGNGYVAYYADKVINAPKGFTDGDFIWFENENGITLVDYLGNAKELTLPDEYNGNSVTSIGDRAFKGCKGLTSIVIPNSVTSIGEHAFEGCSGLKSIKIPNSVTSIGEHAFSKCEGLKKVEINCASVENWFSGLPSIQEVVLGDGVTSIGISAFEGCKGLKTVINFSNLTFSKGSSGNGYVAYYADKVYNAPYGSIEGNFIFGKPNNVNTLLYYLGNATELTLPADYNDENYTIGADVFNGNTTITSIIIPNSVTSFGWNVFKGCSGLKKVEINCASVENWFSGLPSIQEVVLSDGVTSIGDYAFEGCSGLKSIKIPNSVTSIGEHAFSKCEGLKKVEINCASVGTWFSGLPSIQEVVLGNGVKRINYEMFEGCIGLKKIEVNCAFVGDWFKKSFGELSSIQEVVLGDGVTSIGDYAFKGCSGLISVTIGNGVTDIGYYAFYNCSNLKTVINLSSLTLRKGSWDNGYVAYYADKVINAPNGCIDGDFVWDKINGVNTLVRYLGSASELTLPADYNGGRYVIGKSAFRGCTGLTSVVIGNSVTSIGEGAFEGCTGLKSIEIPNSVTSIESFAFSRCSNLTGVVIPNSVTIMGKGVFDGCTRLEK